MSKKFEPLVSIVIPVYKGDPFLRDSIQSALDQTYKNIEVIVVNDGSPDEGKTAAIAKSFGKKIRYFEKENGGVATALNYGIEKMKGEYFSWLSHDDLYFDNKIEEQVKFLEGIKDKETVIFNDVMYIDENGDKVSSTNYGSTFSKKQLSSGIFGVINTTLNGCAMLIHRKCFDKVGMFDTDYPMANDYLMWLSLSRVYEFHYLPQILTKYRFHPNQTTNTSKKFLEDSDNFWSLFIKSLTDKDIKSFDGDAKSVFCQIARTMKIAKHPKSEALALERLNQSEAKPLVTVIMPSYNSIKYIDEAIQSILDQSFCSFELLIVDDKSTDGSYEVAKAYADKDYRVKVVSNKNNKGIAGAMNTGLEMADTKYVTRMDSDDISLLHRLSSQFAFLEDNPNYGACSVNILGQKGKQIIDTILLDVDGTPDEWKFLFINGVANAPMMYRNEIIKKNKLRFNDYKTAEDYDFILRFMQTSRIKQLSEALYIYRIHHESIFQKNIKETISVSKKLYDDFFKSMKGDIKIESEVKILSDFYQLDGVFPKYIDYLECAEDLKKILPAFSKKWEYTQEEEKLAIKYINKQIAKHAVWRYLKENELRYGPYPKYRTRMQRLKTSLKKEGPVKTVKKIFNKIKSKVM